jgi:hypothetical protein
MQMLIMFTCTNTSTGTSTYCRFRFHVWRLATSSAWLDCLALAREFGHWSWFLDLCSWTRRPGEWKHIMLASVSCFGWAARSSAAPQHPPLLYVLGLPRTAVCLGSRIADWTRTPACDWTRIPAISIAIAGVVGKLSGWCSVAEHLWALMDHPFNSVFALYYSVSWKGSPGDSCWSIFLSLTIFVGNINNILYLQISFYENIFYDLFNNNTNYVS